MIRKAYLKKIEARLDDLGDDVARLVDKAEKAGKEAKTAYSEQLSLIRSRQKVALERLRDLREAGSDNWGKFKSGVDESVTDLKKAVENAVEKLRKIA